MFRERIDQTPFTTEEAGYALAHITSDNLYAGDVSFLATARALLGHRMKEGETLRINQRSLDIKSSELTAMGDRGVFDATVGYLRGEENRLEILELTNSETRDACFAAIRKEVAAGDAGNGEWESVNRVEALFRKSFPVNCYINRAARTAILIVDRLSLRKWHSIQVVLFRCLPWFFPENNPITETEKDLVRSLSEDNSTHYLAALRRKVESYDFERARIRRLLNGFETTYERQRIESCKREIQCKRNQIQSYSDAISQLMGEMRQQNIFLMGSMSAIEQRGDQSELMEYFLADRNLAVESVSNGVLKFFTKGYLENYDPDEAESCINNHGSFVSSEPGNAVINAEDARRLMTAVFVDGVIKLRVCAAYTFEIDNNISVTAQSSKRYPAEYSTYLPNPHIQGYSCMGNYRQIINDLLIAGDYVGAVSQCEASCRSLNWGDWTVMCNFMTSVYTSDRQFYELPDGRCVNQIDAVKWLKEQEGTV